MDEFSDFQMAVQLPPPSLGVQPSLFGKNHGISKPPSGKPMSSSTGLRFSSDSSPVHSISSHPSKSDFLNSQVTSMSNHSAVVAPSLPPAPSAATKGGASVGSRLANYDLGLSGPQTPTNGLSNNLDLTTSTVSPFPANFPKTINNFSNHHHQPQPSLQIQRTNQDLLIGEEDKYSALRMLIETDMSSSCSVFEKPVISGACPSTDSTHVPMNTESFNNKPTLQTNNSNISNGTSSFNMNSTVATSSTSVFDANVSNSLNCNNSSVVNSNNLMATLKYPPGNDFLTKPTPPPVAPSIETPTVAADDDSDFGDFGDFQSFTGFTPTPAPVASAKPSSNSFTFSIPSNGTSFGDFQFQTAPAPTTPQISNSVIPQRPVTFDLFSPITPIAPASSLPPLSLQNGACNNDDDDDDDDTEFGDFVSVEPVVSEAVEEIRQCSSLPPVPAAAPLPTNSRWNKHFDLAPIGLIQQTPPPLPKVSSQDDKENVEDIMDIGSYFSKYTSPLENDLTLPKPKTQQSLSLQPPPQQTIAEAEDEDFDAFTGFASATIIKNDLSTRNSDQNKTLDCSIAKPTLPSNPTPSTNTFIRTSLIRNDKVTEIDPVKWNQSVEESNNDCAILDSYSSFDRKDFSVVDGGKSKFLDISPETRSIASLDLGNYVTVDYSEASHTNNNLNNNNNNNNNSICNPIVPLQNQFSQHGGGKSMSPVIPGIIPFSKADDQTIYDEYDKYQCFRDECENEKERYHSEWRRCLLACKGMIAKALAVFSGVSTSEIIREVVADEKGYSYVMHILEVYRIAQRVQKSSVRLGLQCKLESVFQEITNSWETLVAFLLGTCVSTEICQPHLDPDDGFLDSSPEDQRQSCGVCLCDVNTSDSSQFLDYGGKLYHCKCANFWVNEVDTILPSLTFVSSLSVAGSGSTTAPTSGENCHGNSRKLLFDTNNSLV